MSRIRILRYVAVAILVLSVTCRAQNTTVTATVTDPNTQPYAFSTGYAALVCPGNQAPTYNGFSLPRTFTITGFDGTGTFTQVLYDVSVLAPTGCGYQWHITYKDGVTNFITGTITSVTGTGPVNLSAAISAFAVLLPAAPTTTPPGGSNGQLQYNNSGTFGGVLGTSVTSGTGAILHTASADSATPMAIASHSVTQSATLLDVNNQSSVSKDTPLMVRGRGTGSFTQGAGTALFHIAQESQATGFYGWIITNHTADVAKGVPNFSTLEGNVLDNGTSDICGGDPATDGNNNYGCFLWGNAIGSAEPETIIARTACTNCVTDIVPFAVQGELNQSVDLFDALNVSGTRTAGINNIGCVFAADSGTVPFGSSINFCSGACETNFGPTTLGTGATTTQTGLNCLPVNSIIDGVVARVTTTITGACTGWELGDGTTAARFTANNTGLTAGTISVPLSGSAWSTGIASATTGMYQQSATKITITCAGGNPSAGAIRVVVFYHQFTPPTS